MKNCNLFQAAGVKSVELFSSQKMFFIVVVVILLYLTVINGSLDNLSVKVKSILKQNRLNSW